MKEWLGRTRGGPWTWIDRLDLSGARVVGDQKRFSNNAHAIDGLQDMGIECAFVMGGHELKKGANSVFVLGRRCSVPDEELDPCLGPGFGQDGEHEGVSLRVFRLALCRYDGDF